jgi:hypothetical protein
MSKLLGALQGAAVLAVGVANQQTRGRVAKIAEESEARRKAVLERLGRSEAEPATPVRERAQAPTEREAGQWRTRDELAVGCLPCARAHLSTVAGILKEALRFAKGEQGIMDPEVMGRLETAEEDITAIERYDWTPEKILASPAAEREAIERFLPKIRELRQDIHQIASVDDLTRAAANAAKVSSELRVEVLQLKGVDMGKMERIAAEYQSGNLSKEDAMRQAMALIPQAAPGGE